MRRTLLLSAAAVALSAALVAGCGGAGKTPQTGASGNPPGSSAPQTPTPPTTSPQSPTPQTPGPTESNPAGDIPDTQAFVVYQPPDGGFALKVPEGWARLTAGTAIVFTDKLNRIEIASASVPAAPTPQSVTSQVVPALQKQVPKFAMGAVTTVSRPAGQAVLLTYQGDSAPDPVTGKVVRDAFERYAFYHNGREVDLTLSGPVAADNKDPWRIVTDSFGWK